MSADRCGGVVFIVEALIARGLSVAQAYQHDKHDKHDACLGADPLESEERQQRHEECGQEQRAPRKLQVLERGDPRPNRRRPFGGQQRAGQCGASENNRIEAARAAERADSDSNSCNRQRDIQQAERERNTVVGSGDRVAEAPVSQSTAMARLCGRAS